jgi:hypothetical protein
VALVWTPWIPILIGFGYAFHGMLGAKATGIGAVAGGLNEIFVSYGVAATLLAQVFAIVFLCRTFASGRSLRNFFSIVSLCLSGFMIVMVVLFLWLTWSWSHHVS